MTEQPSDTSRAWVEIDLGALRRNGAAIARHSGARLLPMVKADAYGLGANAAVRALESLAPWGYGVATVGEGRTLRDAGVERPIVVFTPLLPADFSATREARLTPVLGYPEAITRWREVGGGAWHLGIDTGMARAGIRWDRVGDVAPLVAASPPEGACTHFHTAVDAGSVRQQRERFASAIAALPVRPKLLHAENGAAVEHLDAPSALDLVRPGIFLYGVGSGHGARVVPEPVVQLRARVVEVRELRPGDAVSYDATWRAAEPRRIATLAIGYADGYRRAFSNRGVVLLNGARAKVAGLVTMDMTMVDASDARCAPGDVATLIGGGGDDALTVADVAERGELSPYELLTGLRGRLPRLYREAA
ncbi:MAG TPA: alanine racemase [Gemmatimonadaceae bacterium]|nr:alanine racemase [Gemmatimonadaceae bacterium]